MAYENGKSNCDRNGPPQLNQISRVIDRFDHEDEEKPKRGQWSGGMEFLLSCISMSVGLGNVWRFPYVAYTNGGGAFLIPYMILVFFVARPIYYMELILGQFSSSGPIKVWNCVPALKGVGYAQMISGSFISIFYNYLMALTLYYFFASFSFPLPWTVCDESKDWSRNCSNALKTANRGPDENFAELPDKYFHNEVLHLSHGLEEITWFNWKLAFCLFLAWSSVFFSIVKGVKSMGKVAYFTAIFPFVILAAILGFALTVDGAFIGIRYFLEPQWGKLLDPIVWYNAVLQCFFSLGVSSGTLVVYASYNSFRKNVYKDVLIISVIDTFSSLLAGCVIFSVLGSMAVQKGVPIEKVASKNGVGLAFIAYPQALAQFTFLPNLWSLFFFIMLFTLGSGSSVGMVETLLTCFKDQFPIIRRHQSWCAFFGCLIFFLCGLPLTTDGGLYIMKLLEEYGVGISVFLYGIMQTVGIVWIYGLNNFSRDIKFMTGKNVSFFWKFNWGFLAPVTLAVLFLYGNMQTSEGGGDPLLDRIPWWGIVIGWILAATAAIQIPLWILITIYKQPGSLMERIRKAFSHTKDWGPADPVDFEEYLKYKASTKAN